MNCGPPCICILTRQQLMTTSSGVCNLKVSAFLFQVPFSSYFTNLPKDVCWNISWNSGYSSWKYDKQMVLDKEVMEVPLPYTSDLLQFPSPPLSGWHVHANVCVCFHWLAGSIAWHPTIIEWIDKWMVECGMLYVWNPLSGHMSVKVPLECSQFMFEAS